MHYNFIQWIDGPEIFDRAFIQQKYMLNYAMRAETFQPWKSYVPDPIEKAPEKSRTTGWWWRTPEQEAEYDRAECVTDKGKAPATETGGHCSFCRCLGALHIEEPVV